MFLKFASLIIFNFIQGQTAPLPDDYWWLAFAPLVITAIIFYIIYWGFRRFLSGDRFIAKLFGISEEDQRTKIIEFREKVRREHEEKQSMRKSN